ncbi:hypothetical protein CJF31_00008121 [Rutstroemia sp. NJR-2017a BVV2]|nr:hypothetical protein CJF31_00008121 [Rutstroemia sp. NJR-2017a BVV2]
MARSPYLINLLLSTWIALLCSLSLSAPLESNGTLALVKRNNAVFDLWNSIPGSQMAQGDSAKYFAIDQTKDNAWGITFLYGCTALMISDAEFVIVAHVQQDTAAGTRCIKDPVATELPYRYPSTSTRSSYSGSSGTGIPDPNSPMGLAVVKWQKPQVEGFTIGAIQVYFNTDTPIRDDVFITKFQGSNVD